MNQAIDLKEVLERVQDDKELLLELLSIFQEDFQQKRKSLDQFLQSKDSEQIKSIAHSLKGASGNISAKKLHGSFIKLETMAQSKEFDQMNQLVKDIDQQFSELELYTKQLVQQFKH